MVEHRLRMAWTGPIGSSRFSTLTAFLSATSMGSLSFAASSTTPGESMSRMCLSNSISWSSLNWDYENVVKFDLNTPLLHTYNNLWNMKFGFSQKKLYFNNKCCTEGKFENSVFCYFVTFLTNDLIGMPLLGNSRRSPHVARFLTLQTVDHTAFAHIRESWNCSRNRQNFPSVDKPTTPTRMLVRMSLFLQ